MGMNSSNLTPTSIVDKNGVRTTRNKKAPAASSAKQPILPPVTLIPAATPDTSVRDLHELVYGKNGGDYKLGALEALHEDDPGTTKLAASMISSGIEPAEILARSTIDRAVTQILLVQKYQPSGDEWKASCADSLSPRIKDNLIRAWTTGNLILETGAEVNPMEIENRIALHTRTLIRSGRMSRSQSTDPDLLRGITIISLAGISSLVGDTQEDAPAFIQWASKRNDPARIVALVQEWETLEVDALESIIAKQDRTTAGLREGVL
jgi:hypothetical protein